MAVVLVVLHVIICFILIAVILLQAGRGQGLTGASFTGGGVQSLFGTRAADFLTKATTVSALLFLFTCIGLDIIETQRSKSLFEAKRPAVPVDVKQIQEVLEKIKAEEQVKGTAAPTPEEKQASSASPAQSAQSGKAAESKKVENKKD